MSEQRKNLSQLAKLAMGDKAEAKLASEVKIDTPSLLIGSFIRYIIVPCLLFYGNNILDNMSSEIKSIRQAQADLSTKLDVAQANSESYKQIVEKQMELIEYRLKILEDSYGKIHSKLFSEWATEPKQTVN